MLLETNRKKSITNKTNHIQVRYFFIKERVATGDVDLKHGLNTKMLGYHFTNPLHGRLLRIFRAELMNIPENTNITYIGWDGKETDKGVSWKLHNYLDPACPQDFVGYYVKG